MRCICSVITGGGMQPAGDGRSIWQGDTLDPSVLEGSFSLQGVGPGMGR